MNADDMKKLAAAEIVHWTWPRYPDGCSRVLAEETVLGILARYVPAEEGVRRIGRHDSNSCPACIRFWATQPPTTPKGSEGE